MFKRICALLGLTALLLCTGLFTASAAEVYELLPQNAFWQGTADGDGFVMLEESKEAFLFYTFVSDKKPSTRTTYPLPITVDTEGYSLVYHFTVEKGSCVIELLLAEANGETVAVSFSELLGKGAVFEKGICKGALPLRELTEEKQAVFLGIRVQIMGSELKVLALDLMTNEDVPDDVSEIESAVESLPAESEESEEESALPSEEERSLTPEESRDAVFVSREDVSFTEEELAMTTVFVTTLSFAGFLVAAVIGLSLFRRTRPHS